MIIAADNWKKYNAFDSFVLENKDILLVIYAQDSEDSPILSKALRDYGEVIELAVTFQRTVFDSY